MKKFYFIIAIINLILTIGHIILGTINWAILSSIITMVSIILCAIDKKRWKNELQWHGISSVILYNTETRFNAGG